MPMTRRSIGMPPYLLRVEHALHRQCEVLPALALGFEPSLAGGRDRVDASPAIVLRGLHLRSDVAGELEPMEGRIERALAGDEALVRRLPDAVGDAPPVVRAHRENAQQEQIERSLQQV